MTVSFDRLNSRVRDKFGVISTFTPEGGAGRSVTVIIERDYFADTPGVGVQSEKIVAKAVTGDVPEIEVGDTFAFALAGLTGTYKVVEVQHDFLGMTDLVLNKA